MNETVLAEQPVDRSLLSYALSLAERGLLPDAVIRAGIRRLRTAIKRNAGFSRADGAFPYCPAA